MDEASLHLALEADGFPLSPVELGLGSCQKGLQRWLARMAEAAEPGAAEGLLIALPALMLGPGSGLQPYGQVWWVGSFCIASDRFERIYT